MRTIANSLSFLLDKVKWFGLRKIYWVVRDFTESLKYNKTLIKYPISHKLIKIYEGNVGHNLDRTNGFLGFGLIHYSFVRNIKPKRILCVGSLKGFIPATLALACKDNGFGKVYFVDAAYDDDNPDKHWSGVGFWKKNNPKDHFKKIGVEKYIDTFVMTTKEYHSKNKKLTYDYIYIDGDHSYDGAKLDYKLFWPKLNNMGFMVFHDIVARGYLDEGLFGVWKLWNEIKNKNAIEFPFPKDSGLGIIQKIK